MIGEKYCYGSIKNTLFSSITGAIAGIGTSVVLYMFVSWYYMLIVGISKVMNGDYLGTDDIGSIINNPNVTFIVIITSGLFILHLYFMKRLGFNRIFRNTSYVFYFLFLLVRILIEI